jgi:hypothetical protein
MVWCARECADFEPGDDNAMQLFKEYGWIHWHAASKSWHTVTGYDLGAASAPADTTTTPVTPAVRLVGVTELSAVVAEAVADALRKLGVEVQYAAPAAPIDPFDSATDAADDAFAHVPGVAALVSSQFGAARGTPRPYAPAPSPTQPQPPSIPSDQTEWDADHKRDGDRDDTQQALENTRWDAQHTLDNTRWDARHTLENTRWDTALGLKRTREDTALAADMSLLSAVHGAYVAVAQGSLDRALQRATYVTTAAGAIGTVYTGVLAARYTISHQAPARSILPAIFIGAAVAFSTWYMAFLRGHTREQHFLLSGAGGKIAETRLLSFMEWTFSGVLARAWSLRAAVISLALALALLPIGLVQLSSGTTWLLGTLALVVLLLWLAGEAYVARSGPGVEAFVTRQKDKPPRLMPRKPTLPAPPENGLDPTTPPAYGMRDLPPRPPKRSRNDDPPEPPTVAAGPLPDELPKLSSGPRPPGPTASKSP